MVGRTAVPALVCVHALLLLHPMPSSAVVINFDSIPLGSAVTNQYPEATFSSDDGFENRTSNFYNLNTSFPAYLMTAVVGGPFTAVNRTQVDFTDPVDDLTFLAGGDDTPGVTAQVDVYVDFVLVATVDVVTNGDFFIPHPVDLTGFSRVTRIVIHSIVDAGGLAWDDFSFTPVTSPVDGTSWGRVKSLFR